MFGRAVPPATERRRGHIGSCPGAGRTRTLAGRAVPARPPAPRIRLQLGRAGAGRARRFPACAGTACCIPGAAGAGRARRFPGRPTGRGAGRTIAPAGLPPAAVIRKPFWTSGWTIAPAGLRMHSPPPDQSCLATGSCVQVRAWQNRVCGGRRVHAGLPPAAMIRKPFWTSGWTIAPAGLPPAAGALPPARQRGRGGHPVPEIAVHRDAPLLDQPRHPLRVRPPVPPHQERLFPPP